jgi:coproporphyrinogen III oxidase-like Fe-S oxidoreductase
MVRQSPVPTRLPQMTAAAAAVGMPWMTHDCRYCHFLPNEHAADPATRKGTIMSIIQRVLVTHAGLPQQSPQQQKTLIASERVFTHHS